MRIVHVCPFFEPHVGGVESHVAMVATELARRGHDVTVLTSRHDRHLPLRERHPAGFEIVRTPTLATLFATPLTLRVGRSLERLPADIVHMHYPPPVTSYFAARVLRRGKTPVCLTYHCDLDLEGPVGALLTGLYQRLFLPPTLEVADRIVVHTEGYAKTSRYLRNVPLAVIPSLVDTSRFQVAPDDPALRRQVGAEGRRVVLFVGRLVPHKGVDDLIRAVGQLPPDVLLVIVGRGPERRNLSRLVEEEGLRDRVRFVGGVSMEDLPRYYHLATLVASPSQNRLEGFGLTPVEAMASGRPVIVADMPGMREVVEDGKDGLLAQPLLAEDLAAKCRSLLDDPARMAAMGREARTSAERKYSIPVVVERLEELYRTLIDGARASPA